MAQTAALRPAQEGGRTAKTGELLLTLAGKHTIVMIEHDMAFVRQTSAGRKVTVLHQGSVLCKGPVDQVQAKEKVIEVYRGRRHANQGMPPAHNAQPHPMLTLSNREVSIGGSRILRGVDLKGPACSAVCLMGRKGVGKTTTLKAIVGLLKPSRGEIHLAEKALTSLSPAERARSGLGYVPQGREIFPHLTVEENLRIGAVARNKKPNGQLDRVFSLFPILKEFLPRKGGMLSGGQQQQFAIGRAFLTEPRILILNEPTEGIQPNVIDQIGDTIRLLRQEGRMSILLVEQCFDFARELADRFAIMDRGAVVAHGDIGELSDDVVRQLLVA